MPTLCLWPAREFELLRARTAMAWAVAAAAAARCCFRSKAASLWGAAVEKDDIPSEPHFVRGIDLATVLSYSSLTPPHSVGSSGVGDIDVGINRQPGGPRQRLCSDAVYRVSPLSPFSPEIRTVRNN